MTKKNDFPPKYIRCFSMRNQPPTFNLLEPNPIVDSIEKEEARDILLSNKKKGCHIRIIELKRLGGWNYFVTGDVPVPVGDFPKVFDRKFSKLTKLSEAREELEDIGGCVLFDEHPHVGNIPKSNDEVDLHPICYFTSLDDADKQILKLWRWANKW